MQGEQIKTEVSQRLWTERETAAFLGMSVQFLRADRRKTQRIAFIKLGTRVLYDPARRCRIQK
jgi:hypothetical protein